MTYSEDLGIFVKELVDAQTRLWPLKSIFYCAGFMTHKGNINRLEEGTELKVIEGMIINCTDPPTHIITSLRGTLDNYRLEVTAMDLKTQELVIIKIQ